MHGFDKVRGEWSLMALCHDFTGVLNVLISSASRGIAAGGICG
jgi:hypothetical protein